MQAAPNDKVAAGSGDASSSGRLNGGFAIGAATLTTTASPAGTVTYRCARRRRSARDRSVLSPVPYQLFDGVVRQRAATSTLRRAIAHWSPCSRARQTTGVVGGRLEARSHEQDQCRAISSR